MQWPLAISAGALAAAVSLAALLLRGDAAEPIARTQQATGDKMRVDYFQLGRDIDVIGALGRPLGRVLIVEGTLFQRKPDERIPKAYASKTIFIAERVNGEPLKKLVHISLKEPQSAKSYDLKSKQKVELTGYEDGGFQFESEEVCDYRRKRGEGETARMQRHFNVDFYVLDMQPVDDR